MTRLHLKHVHQFRDRHGRLRYYFRRPGIKAVPLPGLVGSEEFMAAYQAALITAVINPEIGADRTLPGTINALVVAYYRSQEWQDLSVHTKSNRKPHIERFREAHGSKRVAILERRHIEALMAAIPVLTMRKVWLDAIRKLLQSGVPAMITRNPADGIASPRLKKSKGHHTWTDDEIEQYRAHWPLGTQQRLVMEFALEATSRRAEVIRLGPQHVKNGRIRIERLHGSRDVDIPLTPELAGAIDAMPKAHLTFLVSQWGRPYSAKRLGERFAEWATQAGLLARCRLHGLKKGGMRRLAEAGNTTHELMAVSGHKTLAMVQHYTEAADRLKLADSAMKKRSGNG